MSFAWRTETVGTGAVWLPLRRVQNSQPDDLLALVADDSVVVGDLAVGGVAGFLEAEA